MKVLLLGPYPPPHGGAQTNLVAIRSFLLNQQIPCDVINLTRFRRADAEGVYYPRNAFQVLGHLLRVRYDVIHLHIGGNLTGRLLGLCLVCSLLPWARTVLTFHSGGYPSSKQGRSARPFSLRGFVFRRLDGLIGVNPEIMDLFRKLGVRPERARLILPYIFPDEPFPQELPQPLGAFYQTHWPVAITVGLLEPEYDLPLQIEVLAELRERSPNAGLVIIGSGSLETQLRGLIRSKPYADHIALCGDVPHAVTLRAVSGSTLFLRTPLYDGDSIAVREALHLGIPVIATDNGMRPEGVTLIPPSNPTALLRAIEEQLSQPPRRPSGAEADQQNIRAVLDFYKELTA